MIDAGWAIRRRIIVSVLAWACSLVTYLAIWGKPTSLSEAIATGLILLIGSVIGSYVFGAAWDDKNKRNAEVAHHAVSQSDPTTTNVQVDQ